jgi:hypothetical protein
MPPARTLFAAIVFLTFLPWIICDPEQRAEERGSSPQKIAVPHAATEVIVLPRPCDCEVLRTHQSGLQK